MSEALNLEISDIDGKQGLLTVRDGKGLKDRIVPIPVETYQLLRKYWATHRNPRFIFPEVGKNYDQGLTATEPAGRYRLQYEFRKALGLTKIKKRNVSIHTLRHSYATHCVECGIDINTIKNFLGHETLNTTMIYLHLSKMGSQRAQKLVNSVMRGISNDLC